MVTRLIRTLGPAALVLVALVSMIAALAFGGGADAPLLLDPGPAVRWGLPLAKLALHLAAALALGALVLVCFAFDPKRPEFGRALDLAAGASAAWTMAAAATVFLTFLNLFNRPVSLDESFGALLGGWLSGTEAGQYWVAATIIPALLTVLAFAVRNHTALVFLTLLGVAGLLPLALLGHTGGTADHNAAVTGLFLHIVFAAIWLGGLVAIVLLRPVLERRLPVMLERYSTVALVSFIVVAVSGYVSAELRVGPFDQLLTPYGILVLGKVAALIALGALGAVQRRWAIDRMRRPGARESAWYWWLVTAELAFLGLASGLASALGRTATPQPQIPVVDLLNPTPAQLLTGRPLPPPVSLENVLSLWNPDLLWLLVCAFGVFFYLAGVWRLHRRGDRWPVHRTVLWIAGLALLFYTTNGGINAYERYLFSMHMLAHMLLAMAVPLLLVPAAPITLAMRAIRKRDDGSRGAREWILLLVHSKYFAVLSNPVVAGVIFAGSLWVFYYSPLLNWAAENHVGHQWMIVHFLASGYIFAHSLIGVDPSPKQWPYPMRLLVLLGTMAFHAFFGLSLMTGTGLLAADWYGAMGWDTGMKAIDDQIVGGGIAWSIGEIPTLILAVFVGVMWARSDDREAKRLDRAADRDGDAQLAAYNAMLAQQAERDRALREP